MSFSSGDFLNTIQSHDFEIQIPAVFTANANTNANTASKQQNKKRKADVISLSASSTASEIGDAESTHNTAYYLQLAIDNLMLALNKATDQSIQTKIQFVLAKTQHILLNTADSDIDSQLEVHQQIQTIQTDILAKFQEIQTMISSLQFVNIPAANQLNIAEPASQSESTTLTRNSSLNSGQNTGKKTYAHTLGVPIPLQSSKEKISSSSILQKAEKMPATSARSQSRTHYSNQNKKKTNSQSTVANSAANSSFSFRERRLILVNSRASSIDSMKTRDNINLEFQKQLKLPASELVIAAITKSIKQQNIVLTTTSKYSADYLFQHENVWQNCFEYTSLLKDKAWFKVVAHGIPTDIFNFSKGLDLLKQEIITYNGIQPIAVNWLSSIENRNQKKHASIVIALDTEAAAQKVIKNKLFIAGISVRTAKYEEKNDKIQCQKCQKFGHTTSSCKNLVICQFCAQNHPTRLHTCKICETVGEFCPHTIVKCSNCAGNHAANSKDCAVLTAQQLVTSATIVTSPHSTVSTEIISDSQLQQAVNQAADTRMEEEQL